MRARDRKILIIGLSVLLLSAVAASMYMMYVCGRASVSSQLVYPTEAFSAGAATEVVYYSMEGCPHCAAFDPVWNAVEDEIVRGENAGNVVMSRWDVRTPEGREKANAAGVTSFPHVQKTTQGGVTVFEGSRTKEALMDFCMS